MGQMGVWRIHESIQCRWKVWLQLGNNLQKSPTLKLSKQTAQSTGLLNPLLSSDADAAAASSYTKQGRLLRSLMLSSPNILFIPLMFCLCRVPSSSVLFPLKTLPTMQTWIITKIAIPTNNMIKEITISITVILPLETTTDCSNGEPLVAFVTAHIRYILRNIQFNIYHIKYMQRYRQRDRH